MSTITKEQIEMYASAAEATQTFEMDKGKLICVEPEHMLELARIALASLEAEPVAFVMADDLKDSSIISTPAYRDLGEAMERTVGDVVALYEIPPSQVSLEARDKLSNFVASQEPLGKDFGKVLAENIEGLYVPDNSAPPAPVSVPDENGLFPCPFCGGRPEEDAGGCSEYDGHEHQDYSINCKSCGAEVYCAVGSFEKADIPCSCHHNAREVCVEKWNRRATMLQGAENAESTTTIQTAPALDSSPKIAESTSGKSPVIPDCSCRTCRPVTFTDSRFVVCPECGNKRCPHANDHRNTCTGSNDPGQEGSAYPAAPQQEDE